MIKLDSQLRIQIGGLASAQVGLYHGSDSLLNGNLKQVDLTDSSARGIYSLPSGAILRLELVLETVAPNAVSVKTTVTNAGAIPVSFDRFDAPRIDLTQGFSHEPLWTLQGAAVNWGQDFAFPLTTGRPARAIPATQEPPTKSRLGFARANYLGHVQNGEGGGIPLTYFWSKTQGIALMHIETTPKDWYMPVKSDKEGISTALQLRQIVTLQPGENFSGLKTVISIHSGDFFSPLALYRDLLAAQGIKAPEPVPANYEPAWCSWGYEFDVRPSEMTGVLPVLKELGIHWLTLDDRWFDAYADWNPRADTFPNGADDMRRMNAKIHAAGAFSQIWWYPLCAEDGHGKWESHQYGTSQVIKDHPDWVILNADGSVARNNRHLAMLCPALPEVREHTAAVTRRFIADWGFDGHKLDNIYTIPACYNPAHHHTTPEQSTEAMADVYRLIFEITRQLRPNSVTQICPCGTPLSLQLIPFTDQTVTADPTSSHQVRQRIKFYKALMGPNAAVFADHVELSDNGTDFASGIGAGGVPSTKFIWPDDKSVRARLNEVWDLPDEKKVEWQKWFSIYNAQRPSEGEYLNLYDIAFDYPEGHVICKRSPKSPDFGEKLQNQEILESKTMYYAFYTHSLDETFSGSIELRGLEKSKNYRALNYGTGQEIAQINGANPVINVTFKGTCLMKVWEG